MSAAALIRSYRLMGLPEREIERLLRQRTHPMILVGGVEFTPWALAPSTFPVHDELCPSP